MPEENLLQGSLPQVTPQVNLNPTSITQEQADQLIDQRNDSLVPADLIKRTLAFIVDIFLSMIASYLVIDLLLSLILPRSVYVFIAKNDWVLLPAYFFVFTLVWGATLGKKLLGLVVVKLDGGKANTLDVFLREVIGRSLSSAVFLIGYLWVFINKDGKSWHDLISGTTVVDTRQDANVLKTFSYLGFVISIIIGLLIGFVSLYMFGGAMFFTYIAVPVAQPEAPFFAALFYTLYIKALLVGLFPVALYLSARVKRLKFVIVAHILLFEFVLSIPSVMRFLSLWT